MEQQDAKKAILAANARKIYDLALIRCRDEAAAKAVTRRALEQLADDYDEGREGGYSNAALDAMTARFAEDYGGALSPRRSRARAAGLTVIFVLLLLLFAAALIFAYELMAERGILHVAFRFGLLEWFDQNICPII